MLNGYSLPIICAAKPCFFIKWFACLENIINHPLLQEEEKVLWLWLATKCANNLSFSCSFNYEQIAFAVDKSVCKVHRIIFRLKLMGVLQAAIPIWYGAISPEMSREIRHFRLLAPSKTLFDRKELENIVLLPKGKKDKGRPPLNLLKSRLRTSVN